MSEKRNELHGVGDCVHYDGLATLEPGGRCRADVVYRKAYGAEEGMGLRMPCQPSVRARWLRDRVEPMIPCEKFTARTVEQAQAKADEFERHMKLLARDLSSCCEVPLIKPPQGESGWLYCSKCRKALMHICVRPNR